MIDLGCDPGLTQTALAWVNAVSNPAIVHDVAVVKNEGTGPVGMLTALRKRPWSLLLVGNVVAESQQVYDKRGRKGRKGGDGRVDPKVLIGLAHVSGAVGALANASEILLPEPVEWKGNLDKVVYHEAVLLALGGAKEGWEWDVAGSASKPRLVPRRPPVGSDLPGGAWEHLLDAIGLCLWARRGKAWRKEVLLTSPETLPRRTWAIRAKSLPDPDGLLR